MTPDDVRQRADEIIGQGDRDPETSHIDEDSLLGDVLRAILDGAPDPVGLAREALRLVDDESQTRWYA